MIADAIQQTNEEMNETPVICQFRVARGYRDSCFIVEEADNLMRIVAGPFRSTFEAMEMLRVNPTPTKDPAPEPSVFDSILSRSEELAELLRGVETTDYGSGLAEATLVEKY
jgi:hypothetical protein